MEDNTKLVKSILEQIIGTELTLKKHKKTEEDYRRELFVQVITSIEKTNNRSLLLETEFNLSHFVYDEPFHEIIEALLVMLYGENAYSMIMFYLYDRYGPDNIMIELLNENNEPIKLETAYDLYDLIQKMVPSNTKKKK